MSKKYLILFLVGLAVVSFTVRAFTNEEILQKIASLETEIEEWRALLIEDEVVVVVIEESCHSSALWSWGYCTTACPCDVGEGDCNSHTACTTGYCAYDTGAKYGKLSTIDVCEIKEGIVSVITPVVVPIQQSGITVKGIILDKDTQEPIEGVLIRSSFTDKQGKFEIVTDKNSVVSLRASSYLSFSFSLCSNCKGYNQSLSVPDLDSATKIFPIQGDSIDIGNIYLEKAMDLDIYSDKFITVTLNYKDELSSSSKLGQYHTLIDTIPLNRILEIILKDSTGKEYTSSLNIDGDEKHTLNFSNEEFMFGVCGNGICEKEENTCSSDCSICSSDSECTFGCVEGQCQKDIDVTIPSDLEEGDTAMIEWGQVGLEDENIDIELLAYKEGNIVNEFKYMIVTSTPVGVGKYLWKVPYLEENLDYKIVVYNKMCFGGNETLVSCMKERYLNKSDGYFSFVKKDSGFVDSGLASVSIAAQALVDKIADLLD